MLPSIYSQLESQDLLEALQRHSAHELLGAAGSEGRLLVPGRHPQGHLLGGALQTESRCLYRPQQQQQARLLRVVAARIAAPAQGGPLPHPEDQQGLQNQGELRRTPSGLTWSAVVLLLVLFSHWAVFN